VPESLGQNGHRTGEPGAGVAPGEMPCEPSLPELRKFTVEAERDPLSHALTLATRLHGLSSSTAGSHDERPLGAARVEPAQGERGGGAATAPLSGTALQTAFRRI
jgi:hypothetical protein